MPRRRPPREVPTFGTVFANALDPTSSASSTTAASSAAVIRRYDTRGLRRSQQQTISHFAGSMRDIRRVRVMLGKHSKFAEAATLRESRKRDDDEPILVKLEGDDPPMMGFILHALHGQYKKVPAKITVSQLACIAVICDKYALYEALQIIVGKWLENLKAKPKMQLEQWLLISWVFGPEEIFTEVSRDLILSGMLRPEDEDCLVFGEEMRPLPECIPAAVIDTYCQCGTLVISQSTHNCSYAIAHRDCSWVPKLQKEVEDSLGMVKGLKFSGLPSRTWGWFDSAMKDVWFGETLAVVLLFMYRALVRTLQEVSLDAKVAGKAGANREHCNCRRSDGRERIYNRGGGDGARENWCCLRSGGDGRIQI
ncbi:hypothetical protein K440DRAFT_637476 [Wilcoxina mikolae CBS 423.85]|nr:hypothetical protein K440DRAFT_637476 [Wilcoxina mikolae CBS 423.85]